MYKKLFFILLVDSFYLYLSLALEDSKKLKEQRKWEEDQKHFLEN